MCVQDLRITAGLTLAAKTITLDAAGIGVCPSFRTATLVFGEDSAGTFLLFGRSPDGTSIPVPNDLRFGQSVPGLFVYSRDSLGPFLYQPLFIAGPAAGTCKVFWYEYDSKIDKSVSESL